MLNCKTIAAKDNLTSEYWLKHSDFKNVFYTINHEILPKIFNLYRTTNKKTLTSFNCFLLRESNKSMEGQNFQTKIVKCGVPQDFHLEPLLFLIYIDDLKNTHHKCIILLMILNHHLEIKVSHPTPSLMSHIINIHLMHLSDWPRASKLS